MKLLALSGSLRRDSLNTRLLAFAATRAAEGDEVSVYDDLAAVPHYDEDLDVEPAPASVQRLRDAIATADALLIATPEYNGSFSAVIKNAVDWASRPRGACALQGKPVGVVGASAGSFGAVWAQADLRKVLGVAGARVVDVEVAVPEAGQRLPGDGTLLGKGSRDRLDELLDELRGSLESGRRAG